LVLHGRHPATSGALLRAQRGGLALLRWLPAAVGVAGSTAAVALSCGLLPLPPVCVSPPSAHLGCRSLFLFPPPAAAGGSVIMDMSELMDVVYTTVEDLQVAATSAPEASDTAVVTQAQRSRDGDTIFVNADDLVHASAATALATKALNPRHAFFERRGGYPRRGPGRKKESGLDVRESLHQVLLVLLSTSAYLNLSELFDPSELINVNLEELRNLRHKLSTVTYKALRTRAWDLSRSGAVGVLVKYGTGGSRDDQGRHLAVAVVASLKNNRVVCTCSEAETCLATGGCSMQEPMELALDEVRSALGVTIADLFVILGASQRLSSRAVGRAVLYGPSTCVVRMPGGSWPYAVVRKTRTANWVCFSCRTSDGSCQHAAAAAAAAKGAAADDLDAEADTGDDGSGGDEAMGADEHRNKEPGAGAGAVADECSSPDRRKQMPQSMLPRHLVPPGAAQEERAMIVLALVDPAAIVLFFPAADVCPYCKVARESFVTPREVLVECGEGVASGMVHTWRCHECNYRVIPDGRDQGVVFSSSSTAYSEVFLFEMSVNLSRNGSSLRSSAYYRDAYWEMSTNYVYPEAKETLGSVTTLRKAVILYLKLVIAGLPAAVTRCARCVRIDGSYAAICFDGLQLGYRLKFMIPFLRSSTPVSPIARASVYARVIKDEALSKALGGVLSHSTASKKNAITTITAMRGNVMAFVMLTGYVVIGGTVRTFSGNSLPKKGGKQERGWDPVDDGGVRLELIDFFRVVFVCRRAACALAMDILGGPRDLLRRVPGPLIEAVKAAATDFSDDANEVSGGKPPDDAANEDMGAVGDRDDDDQGERDELSLDDQEAADTGEAASDGSWASDGELSDSGMVNNFEASTDDDFGVGPAYEPPTGAWDDHAPLRFYAEQFAEPALADTGGASGSARIQKLVLPLRIGIPCTAASALKLLDFVRAVVVDPFTVWAPGDNWSAVNAVFDCLLSEDFTVATLSDVVARADVSELRLLRGAVASLAPALCANAELRRVFGELLLCLVETRADYNDFVADAAPSDSDDDSLLSRSGGSDEVGDSDEEEISKEAMALAHPEQPFTAQQYTRTWLLPEATAAAYASAYSLPVGQVENFLRTGVWAPGLPVLRSMPGFVGASTAQTDFPNCQHEMGKQKAHTGGTFGGFCTCKHPKCLGVVVLDKSESQRMPIEFVVQRFATLPDTIIYDFACAALKTALVRLPHVAKKVSLRVDRFHWRKNHTQCSKAMSPDSYVSMDGTNTSSSEERNALSRRQQHHLRQMKQDSFIIFTVYQQAVSNVVAMYRDSATKQTTIKWPEWYRRAHVDNE